MTSRWNGDRKAQGPDEVRFPAPQSPRPQASPRTSSRETKGRKWNSPEWGLRAISFGMGKNVTQAPSQPILDAFFAARLGIRKCPLPRLFRSLIAVGWELESTGFKQNGISAACRAAYSFTYHGVMIPPTACRAGSTIPRWSMVSEIPEAASGFSPATAGSATSAPPQAGQAVAVSLASLPSRA